MRDKYKNYGVFYNVMVGTDCKSAPARVVPASDARYPRTVYGINRQWLHGLKDSNTGKYIYRPENYHR